MAPILPLLSSSQVTITKLGLTRSQRLRTSRDPHPLRLCRHLERIAAPQNQVGALTDCFAVRREFVPAIDAFVPI